MRTETQTVRLRSANRGNSNNTWYVNSDGNVNNNNANYSLGFAPGFYIDTGADRITPHGAKAVPI